MDVTVGVGGAARYGRYAPVTVSLDNRGARVEGTLRVESSRILGFRSPTASEIREKRIVLPPRARLRARFAVPLSAGSRPLVVKVLSDGRELARMEIDLHSVLGAERIVMVLSGGASVDYLYGLENGGDPLRLTYPHVESLPESWIGYDGVDLMVLRDIPAGRLSAPQAEAIRRWVASGGTLVVSGGIPALGHGAAGLDVLLPSKVTGVRGERVLGGIRQIAETGAPAGRSLLEEGGLVLASERDLGAGRIVFAAFDLAEPGLSVREEIRGLWAELLRRPREPVLGADRSLPTEDPAVKALLVSPSLDFPPSAALAAFLAAYLACVAILLSVRFREGLRPSRRCAVLAAAAFAAGTAGYLLFGRALYKDAAGFADVSTVRALPGGLALVTQETFLAAAAPGIYEVRIGAADVAVEDGGSLEGGAAGELVLEDDRGTVVRGIGLARYTSRILRLHAVLPFPLEAVRGSGAGLRLSNGTGRTLEGCLVVRRGTAYPLGDLPPGDRTISAAELETPAGVAAADPLRRQLAEQAAAGLDKEGTWLLGWLAQPLLDVSVPTPFARRVRECLVVAEVAP